MKRMAIATVVLAGALALAAQTISPFQTEIDAARTAMAGRHYNQARKAYQRAAKQAGADELVCEMGMADADAMRASFGDAEKECVAALRLARDTASRAEALNLAGAVWLKQAANDEYQSPGSKSARKLLARGDASFRAALALTPRDPTLHFNLATALLREGETAAGVSEAKAYLRLAPQGDLNGLAREYLDDPYRALAYHAPEFAVVTNGGEHLSLRGMEGKVVLLDFWGSWCPPCRESVPVLAGVWRHYARAHFVMLSIDSGETLAAGARFIAAHKMVWPQVWDADAKLQNAFGVRAYPTFILLDSRGVMRGRWEGEEGWRTGALLDGEVHKWLKRAASVER